MDNKEITTSEGHKVYLKQDLTHKEKKEVNRIAKSAILLDLNTGKPKDVSMADLERASRLVLDYLTVKIVNPDGTEAVNAVETIDNMSPEDETMLLQEADKVTQSINVDKKKEKNT